MTTPPSSIAWVMTGSVIGSLGAAGLKAGAHHLEISVRGLLTNWRLIGGLGGYLLSTVFFIRGVQNGEVSLLYPMVAVGYIWSLIWSKVFFGEPITRMKVGALAVILTGVAVLCYGGTR
jgi:multidrug transporter EmrE-like cation transporter